MLCTIMSGRDGFRPKDRNVLEEGAPEQDIQGWAGFGRSEVGILNRGSSRSRITHGWCEKSEHFSVNIKRIKMRNRMEKLIGVRAE